ncbi:MAG TPA: glycosyltransferase family 2 protein [Clostridia bacterium]|nr:glycosyltransferase family 2 protein [Clostridia bacterium]
MNRKLISIVVPMYYEEKVAEECYKRLKSVMDGCGYEYELVFVNDGSRDGTPDILERIAVNDRNVKVLGFSRNFGHQVAVTAGIDKARGNAIIIIDADLQDPPELIPEMLKLWEQGYEVVYAKRKRRKGESLFKRTTARIFYIVLDKLSDTRIPLDTGDFRLIDAKVADELRRMREKNRFLRGMVSWIGFKQTPIEYEREERFAGETKYPLKKMVKLALDGIISFSSKPLKLSQYLGFFAVVCAMVIFIYSLVYRLVGGKNLVTGWASIMTTVAFLGGVQLISIGILGEYIGRMYEESKGRPLYIIEKEINFDDEEQ